MEHDSAEPVGRLYRYDTGICWQAPYSSSSGYGIWTETSTGPLGVSCTSVSSAAWYTRAIGLTDSATYTGAGSISSGYIGIVHMVHEAGSNMVFGGELDGRTLSNKLLEGKPVQGEIYVVSTSNSVETLVATTENSMQSQLYSSSAVDAGSVGGLTGSSAQTLRNELGTFSTLWSNSGTVAQAEMNGFVSQRCPSESSAAYIAVGCASIDNARFASQKTLSLQRLHTTEIDLELLMVVALNEGTYFGRIDTALYASLTCGGIVLLSSIILGLMLHPSFVEWVSDSSQVKIQPRHIDRASVAITVLVLLPGVVWLICISSEHNLAMKHLTIQVTRTVLMTVSDKMAFSSSMVQEAASTWMHTGAITTGLSSLDSWMTLLLKQYNANAGLATLRFGTNNGLEESVNASATGTRVLRREGDGNADCLKTYLADGVTPDSNSYLDDCNHDPRYSSWYQAGRVAATDSSFSDTYNNTWFAATTKACPSANCGSSSGVWAVEWSVASISPSLAQLSDGFEGSLALIDFNGIVLSSSSGVTLEPAISCSDAYIVAACKETVEDHTKYFREFWSGSVLRDNLIGVDVLTINTDDLSGASALRRKGGVSASGSGSQSVDHTPNTNETSVQYYGLLSFARLQLYQTYEETRNVGLAFLCFGLIFMGLIVGKVSSSNKSNMLHTFERNSKVLIEFEETIENQEIKILRAQLDISLQDLGLHLRHHPIQVSDLRNLDDHTSTNFATQVPRPACSSCLPVAELGVKQVVQRELSTHEAMQRIAVYFLQDLSCDRDPQLHLALLLCLPSWQFWLIPTFRAFSSRAYWLLVRLALVALLWVELTEGAFHGSSFARACILAVLFLDAVLYAAFCTIKSLGLDCGRQDHKGSDNAVLSSILVFVPWRFPGRLGITVLYLLLLVVAFVSSVPEFWNSENLFGTTTAIRYIAPVLVLLRNEEIWPAMSLFVDALSAAGPIMYLWICLLLVLAGMATVLLHDQFETGDFYLDSQFQDFYRSLSTLSVHLIDNSNFTDVIEPALAVHGLYVVFFLVTTLFSLFFVSAIVLTLFMNTYSKGTNKQMTPAQQRRMVALTLAHSLWTQAHEPESNGEARMSPLSFERLMLQSHAFSDMADSWIPSAQTLLQSSIALLNEHPGDVRRDYPREVAALTSCALKLQFEEDFQSLLKIGSVIVSNTDSGEQRGSSRCFEVNNSQYLANVLVSNKLCQDDLHEQVGFVQSAIGPVSDQEAHILLANTTVPLLSNSGESQNEEHIRSVITKALKLSLSHLQANAIRETGLPTFWGLVKRSVEDENVTEHGSRQKYVVHQTSRQCPLLRNVHELYEIDSQSHNPITQRASALISLVHVHIFQLRIMFNSLDINADSSVSLSDFNKLWSMTNVASRLATSSLYQAEAEELLLTCEIDDIEQQLQGVMLHKQRAASIQKLEHLKATAEQLKNEIKLELGGYFSHRDDRLALLQIAALLNLGVVAYMMNPGSDQGTFDWVLSAFPLFFAIEFVFTAGLRGFPSRRHPALQLTWWLGGLLILSSLAGASLLAFDSNQVVMRSQHARTLASLNVLLIISSNKRFGSMILAFSRASRTVIPTMIAIVMVAMLYAAASMDMFSDKVIDPSTELPYFESFGSSLTTMFTMFNGNWHDTMWAATEATTEGAQLWFTSYVFVISVFCCELFIGVMIAGYAEVQEITSPRLYWALTPAFEECSHDERGTIVNRLLKLARQMRPCNDLHVMVLQNIAESTELLQDPSLLQQNLPKNDSCVLDSSDGLPVVPCCSGIGSNLVVVRPKREATPTVADPQGKMSIPGELQLPSPRQLVSEETPRERALERKHHARRKLCKGMLCPMCRSQMGQVRIAYLRAECMICLEEVDNIRITECGHSICDECLQKSEYVRMAAEAASESPERQSPRFSFEPLSGFSTSPPEFGFNESKAALPTPELNSTATTRVAGAGHANQFQAAAQVPPWRANTRFEYNGATSLGTAVVDLHVLVGQNDPAHMVPIPMDVD